VTRFITSFEEIGRAEGQLEERRAIILRQLNRKVGPLTEELNARVSALPPELLLALSEALLDFAAQTDLVNWLDANGDKQTA
jgi:hypothetical protein